MWQMGSGSVLFARCFRHAPEWLIESYLGLGYRVFKPAGRGDA
jgi:hypothetical protein